MFEPRTNDQFAIGFTSALLLMAALALFLYAYNWFSATHGSFVEFMTTPMFSFVDLFSWTAVLLAFGLAIVAVKWGPSP